MTCNFFPRTCIALNKALFYAFLVLLFSYARISRIYMLVYMWTYIEKQVRLCFDCLTSEFGDSELPVQAKAGWMDGWMDGWMKLAYSSSSEEFG